MNDRSIVPTILSGGSGTRLWPLSRTQHPKQMLSLSGRNSLLQDTALRVVGGPFSPSLVICNGEHRFIIRESLSQCGAPPERIVLEPLGRGTAAAAAVASIMVHATDPDGVVVLVPSDLRIDDTAAFRRAVLLAADVADRGWISTLGIAPSGPETGYGYLHMGDPIKTFENAFHVTRFIEKPDTTKASQLIESGGVMWNSGIFVFRADVMIEEFRTRRPDIFEHCARAVDLGRPDLDFFRLDADAFSATPPESLDYAIIEATERAAVVPACMGWQDVGSWNALWNSEPHDTNRNVIQGDAFAEDVHGSVLRGDGILVAALGVRDLVVVATRDAVLVADRRRTEEIRGLVRRLAEIGRAEVDANPVTYRPWGNFGVLCKGDRYQAKEIVVRPGASLSLQRHNHRAEHWIVVSGTAEVICEDKTVVLYENQSTFIPRGSKHRLSNIGKIPLRIIEIQSGEYLGEDDIERFDDIYRRGTRD
jgi:mannose-1-phosphate guanylyltransferase/mannose-6-phosphate isomerase